MRGDRSIAGPGEGRRPCEDLIGVVEAAWSYQSPPAIWAGLRKRQQSASGEAVEIAWKAQHRLHKRYARLAAAGKDKRKIVTAVGRELLGFIWAIGTKAEATVRQRVAA